MTKDKNQRSRIVIEKELKAIEKQEARLRKNSLKEKQTSWKQSLEENIPAKVLENLQKAFCKAFGIIFEKGTGIIEKSYKKDEISQNREVHDFEFQVKGSRAALKKTHKSAAASNLRNMAITTAEGVGLGVIGVGLPDIVIFVGVLLKGIYEVSLNYGFDYDSKEERYLILKMMETAMLKEQEWEIANAEIDRMIFHGISSEQKTESLDAQIGKTADAFAMDMVILKFIQGLPVVGAIGGAGNPVYYNKVLKYVELKYRKRYLLQTARKQ